MDGFRLLETSVTSVALPSSVSGVSSARPLGLWRICRIRASKSCVSKCQQPVWGQGSKSGQVWREMEKQGIFVQSPESPLMFHFGQRIYFIWFLFKIYLSLTIFAIFGDIIFLVSFSSLSIVFFSYLSIFKIIDLKSLSPESIAYPSSGTVFINFPFFSVMDYTFLFLTILIILCWKVDVLNIMMC